ncbi:MAG: DUF1232 domain-containing protein [Erysipelothrix sp.]|nr:DUF1232 domain-containing protein [Erysipelothrix sp.]
MKFKNHLSQSWSRFYSQTALFTKIIQVAQKAGIKVIYLVLLLFYTLQQSSTPKYAKSIILGALGYFILPTDFVADFIPMVGFSDDLTALLAATAAVALYVTKETKAKAKERLNVWFTSVDKAILDEVDQHIDEQRKEQAK